MSVIKAADSPRHLRGPSFNFDDMAVHAQTYLDQVRAEARKIVEQAKKDADAIRKQADEQGRQEGQKAIQQFADQQVARQMETALPALREAVRELHEAKQAWQLHWEQQAVQLAAAMAAKIARCELTRQPTIPLALVRESLHLAAGSPQLRLRMNPEDHQALASQVDKLLAEFSRVATAEVLPDAAVTRGGCRVETKHGAIDQQFEAQLARIAEELT